MFVAPFVSNSLTPLIAGSPSGGGGGGSPPVNTADMSSPDAEPEPGSTITIAKGRTAGVPVDGVLTLGGVDVTGDATDTGPTLVYVVPDETITEMRTLLFTPVTGQPVSRTIFGNTWEALTQPGISYNPAAPEWRDAVNWR